MDGLEKKYYRINEVSEMLSVPYSTLRFWETRFKKLKPRRNAKGSRFYTPSDVRLLTTIHYLVKTRGLKLEAAQELMDKNPGVVERRAMAVARLMEVRNRLQAIVDSLPKR